MKRIFSLIILSLVPYCLAADLASRLPKLENLFYQEEGFTGADGAYSIPLGQDRLLWLFGDTWVGKIENNQRIKPAFIHNSVAIQRRSAGAWKKPKYFYGSKKDGSPTGFLKPADGKGWYWFYHGLMVDSKLWIFAMQMGRTGLEGLAGFEQLGSWLLSVDNPQDSPRHWKVVQRKLPHSFFGKSFDITFGSTLVREGDFLYVYGLYQIKRPKFVKNAVIARVDHSKLAEFNAWRFYSYGSWVNDFKMASTIFAYTADEYTVHYHQGYERYLAVFNQNSLSKGVYLASAKRPFGPFERRKMVYECPEMGPENPLLMCYAAKAHPALGDKERLILSYVTNTSDLFGVLTDARQYWPRFMEMTWSEAFED